MKFSCLALFVTAWGSLYAAPILSCPVTVAQCNGNEYAVSELSNIGNTYQLELDIHVLATYTGNQFTDLVNALQLKNFASGTITNTSVVSAPGGLGLWNPLLPNELSANACDGGSTGAPRMCDQAKSPSLGAAFGLGDMLSWVFQFDTTGTLNSTAEIKYLYVTSSGDKVGSLGSYAIGIQSSPVPEPVSMSLVGGGLVVLGLLRRKRRSFHNKTNPRG
ncbi:MAG: PEP-CTERM sorting domain-containing protein [Acidobacteriia bacterium]|nr:PEP-CTERM sorting domain-containing protein [Terriglobia bacterium]